VLGSVALHAMLVLALLGIEPNSEPSSSRDASGILYAELVQLTGSEAAGGRVREAPAIAPNPLPAARTAGAPAPPTVSVADRPPPTPEPAATVTVAPSLDLEMQPLIVAGALQMSDAASTRPVEPSFEPAVVVHELESLAPELHQAAVETTQIRRAQRRMLDRKILEWSARLDELSDGEIAWTHEGQEYAATVTRSAAEDSMGIEQVVVAVSTEQDGSRWSTQMRFKRLAFSSFAQFVDRWDSRVMIHDDAIGGRFHSNSEILIANSRGVKPAFYGKVTTADGVNTSSSTRPVRHSEVFLGGLETRVKRISLPSRFLPFPTERSVAAHRVQRFDADARIRFYGDGSYGWEYTEAGAPEQRVMLSNEPHYLVAAEDVDLHVRGIVNGKLLVYAPEDIVIEDDLIYAEHPASFPESDDYLGLVADRNVVIGDPETTGPGDLTVHAAIYAKRRFTVSRYSAPERATLRMYGSVAAGSLSATEPRFRTEIEFDGRLEDARPPGFPVTDRYEVVAWDGRWAAEAQP
jgi:hypothetical protein